MRSAYLVVVFVACVVCSSVLADEPEPVLADAALQQILQQRINGKKAVGFVVGRLQGTNRSIVAAGTMALNSSRSVDGNTVFEIGSITKVFTGTVLADMAHVGRIELDKVLAGLSSYSLYSVFFSAGVKLAKSASSRARRLSRVAIRASFSWTARLSS